ncbi:Nitroreductase-like protein [Venturia nashicola]|uniref:Nitroreductase-like protein n=1 Tax=Venturia nashicola TaxID=86259 RepID=A0A4Z1PMH6_9PEZI|nr:Nitroreductase-like protein [Venturia nashicola]
MASSKSFADADQERTSYFQLNKESPISDNKLRKLVTDTVLNARSSFSQSIISQSIIRAVLLLHPEHEKFWEITKEVSKPKVLDADEFATTVKKLDGFKAGYDTILFFEDPNPIQEPEHAFSIDSEEYPQQSENASTIQHYVLCTDLQAELQAEGFGCDLQHYDPSSSVVWQRALKEWGIPLTWTLEGQLVFGVKAGEPGEK